MRPATVELLVVKLYNACYLRECRQKNISFLTQYIDRVLHCCISKDPRLTYCWLQTEQWIDYRYWLKFHSLSLFFIDIPRLYGGHTICITKGSAFLESYQCTVVLLFRSRELGREDLFMFMPRWELLNIHFQNSSTDENWLAFCTHSVPKVNNNQGGGEDRRGNFNGNIFMANCCLLDLSILHPGDIFHFSTWLTWLKVDWTSFHN